MTCTTFRVSSSPGDPPSCGSPPSAGALLVRAGRAAA
eukprot:CAMPEP_0204045302 /NCGR_PEP_ID=MMETSP0360-20130528/107538_1 /ASSEMBLY_ACC=CAM_ASM_000342 /TAXON_ID=268821 /ORGANISM="Scrippsiella Hangoei, Strain SHTV-5" /LENGTH=36 /DNA_ID= /DNA_START= /DNA_END= /DNA_ORIENTATION=